MRYVIVLELDALGPEQLGEAVEALKAADIPYLVPVLRVADGAIASQVLESINPPKKH